MLFDTHSHIYFEPLDSQESDILARMWENNISHAVQIWCNPESNLLALELAKKYPHLPATVGIHPTDGQEYTSEAIDREFFTLDKIISENRQFIVGIWETGLDYFHLTDESQKQVQSELFIRHIELAKKHDLPIIIHCRDARDDMFELIKKTWLKQFVLHCYSEDLEFAQKILDYSSEAYFGFSGIVTYKNAIKVQGTAAQIPLNRILIETDAPFLAPQPVRWQVNEPSFVRFILEKIQELRTESPEKIEETIYENSLRFYKIKNEK